MNAITRQIIIEARKYVGVKETQGPNRGPEINEWLYRAGSVPGQPWCAAFVSCMLDDACTALRIPAPIRLRAGVHMLIRECGKARTLDPGAGFIFGIDHGTGPGGTKRGHCGIVVEIDPDGKHMTTIEGNTDASGSREGQGVYYRQRRISEATLGFVDVGLLVAHG